MQITIVDDVYWLIVSMIYHEKWYVAVKLELAWRAKEYTVDRCLRYLDSAIPVARAGSDEGLTAVWKVVASPLPDV